MHYNICLTDRKMEVEGKRFICSSFYTFKKNTPLRAYIAKKNTSFPIDCFSLHTLFDTLKIIIRDETMYDVNNVAMVIGSPDLEAALGIKTFHVSQIRDIVMRQLDKQPKISISYSFKALQSRQLPTQSCLNVQFRFQEYEVHRVPNRVYKSPIQPKINLPIKYKMKPIKYEMKPELKEVLLAELQNSSQTLFTYNEVKNLLRVYCYKHQLCDPHNQSVFNIKSNPLEKVFKVQAFAYSQLDMLLLPLLIQIIN